MGRLFPEWHLLPDIAWETFLLRDQLEMDMLAPSCTNEFQHLLYFWESVTSHNLGVEHFEPFLAVQISCTFTATTLVPIVLSKFLTQHVTGKFWLLLSITLYWIDVLTRLGFNPHLSGSGGATKTSTTKVSQQYCKNGMISALKRAYQTMPFLPINELFFCFVYLGLD